MNKRLANAFQAMYKAALKQVKVNYIFSNLSQFISIICCLCVIGIGGYKVLTYELSIGFFSIINTYFSMIISSTAYFLSLAGAYQEAKVSVNRLNRIYHAEPEVYGTKKIDHADKITLNSLSVKYDNTTVIDRLSFTFEKGKIYLICGENGSGKTTILNCIAGLYTNLCTGDNKITLIVSHDSRISDICDESLYLD